jgi:hypothetical protein
MGNLQDSSGNGFTAAPSGGVSPGGVAPPGLLTSGPAGIDAATDFDGVDDYITGNITQPFWFPSALTIVSWIKPDALPNFYPSPSFFGLIAHGYWDSTYLTLFNGGEVGFAVGSNEVQGGWVATGVQNISIGNTYMVVARWDGKKAEILINGAVAASADIPGTNIFLGQVINVGGGPTGDQFNGKIDELAIFPYALTHEQIQKLYQTGKNIA